MNLEMKNFTRKSKGGELRGLLFILLTFLKIFEIHGLTFDNQLVIIANDCYTRISIGSRLSKKDVTSSIRVHTISDCEDECSIKRDTCKVFDFGIGVKGNATCSIGSRVPDPEELQSDPEYDVYIRRQDSPHCESERTYKISGGDKRLPSFNDNSKHDSVHGERPAGGFVHDRDLISRKPSVYHFPKLNGSKAGTSGYYDNSGRPWDHKDWISSHPGYNKDERVSDNLHNRSKHRRPSDEAPTGSSFFYYDDGERHSTLWNRTPLSGDRDRYHKVMLTPGGFGAFINRKPLLESDRHIFKPSGEHSIFGRPNNYDKRLFDDPVTNPVKIICISGNCKPSKYFSESDTNPASHFSKSPNRISGSYQYSINHGSEYVPHSVIGPTEYHDSVSNTPHHINNHRGPYDFGKNDLVIYDHVNTNSPFDTRGSLQSHESLRYTANTYKRPRNEKFFVTQRHNKFDRLPYPNPHFTNGDNNAYWNDGYRSSRCERILE